MEGDFILKKDNLYHFGPMLLILACYFITVNAKGIKRFIPRIMLSKRPGKVRSGVDSSSAPSPSRGPESVRSEEFLLR